MHRLAICTLVTLLAVSSACDQPEAPAGKQQSSVKQPKADSQPKPENQSAENPCLQFDKLNTLVRDGLINRETARQKIQELLPKIRDYFYANGGTDSAPEAWRFPIEGYGPKSIGGKNGSGYLPKGYDYFDGNRHGGHPAHDIFIMDKNQDELDDATRKPVNVLSVRNGVVVASANEWTVGSELRGGKYIYVFDPAINGLIYYAHNKEVFVKPGEIVTAGRVLATVGRSGKSASAARSPTHLHIMWLVFTDGYPKPNDLYPALLKAETSLKPKP
jgi:murein DD-endopeptidase MepM/ murein hydrolase activator NlpD